MKKDQSNDALIEYLKKDIKRLNKERRELIIEVGYLTEINNQLRSKPPIHSFNPPNDTVWCSGPNENFIIAFPKFIMS